MPDYSPLGVALRVKAKPTVAELERQLRAVFMDPDTHFRYDRLPDCVGYLDNPGKGRKTIRIDPFRAALPTIIHELGHVAWEKQLAEWGQAEERVILTIEDLVERYVNRSKKRIAWWRGMVQAKLDEDE